VRAVETRITALRNGTAGDYASLDGGEITGLSAGGLGRSRKIWLQFFGADIDADARGVDSGYDAVVAGGAFGLDKEYSRNKALGAAVSYANSDVTSDGNSTSLDVNSFQVTGYGTYDLSQLSSTDGRWFADGVLAYAYNTNESIRRIIVGALNREAIADYDSQQFAAKMAIGTKFYSGGLTFTPSVSLGYAEYMQALGAQYFREQNTEQTIKRQTARLIDGYWPFRPPLGYEQKKMEGHGKVMAADEPYASIIREGLEGYATGRFQTQAEVARFFESMPDFPKTRLGTVTNEAANRILTRLIYAGHIEMPSWGISLREGKHEGLITLETFNRIQGRLKGRSYVAARADINADFPLRGFVRCTCGKPLTACWSKSKTGKKHPYYMCYNKLCDANRKSIPRAALEDAFTALLKGVQPSPKMYRFTKAILKKAWDMHGARAAKLKAAAKRGMADLEIQITALLERILKVSNETVLARFEDQIETLEMQKLAMAEKLRDEGQNHRPFDEMFELAMRFFSNPCNIWENGKLEHKRTVLKLAFAEGPVYDRKGGFRTPKTSMIFSALEGFDGPSFKMAEGVGFEPTLGDYPKHAFQACALSHSAIPPSGRGDITRRALWVQEQQLFSVT
jgi:site-specific DNA recombinase